VFFSRLITPVDWKSSMRKSILTASLLVGTCLAPTIATAQFSNSGSGLGGSMGNSGGFGGTSSSFGSSSGFGSLTGTSSAFGSGASGFGAGGMGGTGFGSTSGGMGGQIGQSGFGGQGQGQGGAGNFIGTNQNPNQFLGRTAMGQTNGQGMNGGMNQFGAGSRSGARGATRGNQNAFQAMNGGSTGGNNSNLHPPIRPRLRVAFDAPIPDSDELQSTLETRLTRMSIKNPKFNSIMIAMNPKGEVVLRGKVDSESDSKLAANLMRLEPGVRSVRNELSFPEANSKDDE
jgi:BON domain